MAEEVVYFVAIRTTTDRGGAEIREALKRVADEGLLPETPQPKPNPTIIAWYKTRPFDHGDDVALEKLGLDDVGQRGQIAGD